MWGVLGNRVGLLSTPGRTSMLKKQGILKDGNAGSLGQTSEGNAVGFEGNRKRRDLTASKRYWMRGKCLGLRGIESEGIWRRVNAIEWGEMQGVSQQKQGVLEQTSEGTQWVWGESNAKGYGGRTLLKEGKCKEFYSK